MNIYLKFCGGCNPRYDRTHLASRIEERFPQHSFTRENNDQDITLVICGCSASCADRTDLAAPYGVCTVWNSESFDDVCRFIEEASRAAV